MYQLDRFMNDLFTPVWNYEPTEPIFKNTDLALIADIEIPGYESNQISITVAEHTLELVATRSDKSISRKYFIPKEVDASNATAELKNGILKITLPKKQTAVKIPVK